MVKMGAEGCGWIHIGAMGGMRTGENKNKAKECPNYRAGHVLACTGKDKNKQELDNE